MRLKLPVTPLDVARMFLFLEREYGFHKPKIKTSQFGFRMTFMNPTTGVVVQYSPRDIIVDADIARLTKGKMPPEAVLLGDDWKRHWIGLEEIEGKADRAIRQRLNEATIVQKEPVLREFRRLARLLKAQGPALLRGDFTKMEKRT